MLMEDFVVTRAVRFPLIVVPVLTIPVLLAVLGAGCSSRTVDTGASARAAGVPVATARAPSRGPATVSRPVTDPSTAGQNGAAHRPTRPIPEVIAKARRFRLTDADDATPQTLRTSAVEEVVSPPSSGEAVRGFRAPRTIEHAVGGRGPDVAGIGSMMRSYLQAFNRHDAAALAAHWSPTGENLDLDSGESTNGRDAVHEVFSSLFEEDAGATIDIDVTSIRPLRDDVAVVDGVSRITFTDGTPSSSRFSAVVVRQGGTWMLDTVRESSTPLQAASSHPLDELAWLLGSWEDVSDGVTASTHGSWAANRSFLVRTHVVTGGASAAPRPLPGDGGIPDLLPAGAGGSREITEIIGWDPDRREIRSWVFTSAGRVAEGSWSRDGDAWTVRLECGTAGDGVFTLTRRGADELSCRTSSHALGDVMPPACDYVRTARAAPATTDP